MQYRTTTNLEKLILTWMTNHVNEISINKVSELFLISKNDSEKMINWLNLNPDSNFDLIRTQ